jgi:hypothetical protein
MPPEKEIMEGSAARLMSRRISDERMPRALAENSTMGEFPDLSLVFLEVFVYGKIK